MANGTGLKERTKMKLRGCDGVPVALEAWPRRMTLGWCPLHYPGWHVGMSVHTFGPGAQAAKGENLRRRFQ